MLMIPQDLPEWVRPLATELGYPADIELFAGTTPAQMWEDKVRKRILGPWKVDFIGIPLTIAFEAALKIPTSRTGVFTYRINGREYVYWPIARRISKPGVPWLVEEWWYLDSRGVTESKAGIHEIADRTVFDAPMRDAWAALAFLRGSRPKVGRRRGSGIFRNSGQFRAAVFTIIRQLAR